MYDVYDWAEVHRLHREGHSNSAIARRLGMSRTTVIRLLRLDEPPAYRRAPKGSILDPFKDRIAGMLLDDPAFRASIVNRIPLARVGETRDLVGPVVFLCSEAAGFVTGQILAVDGGLTATQ